MRNLILAVFIGAALGCDSARSEENVDTSAIATANVAPPRTQVGSAAPDTTVPGQPAPGMAWEQHALPQFCEVSAQGSHREVSMHMDSAVVVAAARRALGAYWHSEMRVESFFRGPNGVLLALGHDNPNLLDGTATVYVTPGPCITLLGW